MNYEQIKLAILVFACIIDIIAFSREVERKNYLKSLGYLGFSVWFCYLLAGQILK